jgi:alpha-D-ribose 1-methylphosphonate 5-triphosphate synthase subunit PhnG
MKPGTERSIKPRTLGRKLWTAAFRISAVVLILCMVAIVSFTTTIGYSWVYWVAMGSAVVCAVSAAVLRKSKSEEAAGDASWLLSFRERDSKQSWDLDVDD